MEMRFDPMTGEPLQTQPETKQPEMRFDPMTGEPLQVQPEVKQPEIKFDPMTGEPLQAQPEAKQPEMRFDPMTGEPLQVQPEVKQPEIKFDPMTGQPVQPGTQAPIYNAVSGIKKKNKLHFGIGVAAVVVAVCGIAFAGIKSGLFLSKSGKVALATANTLNESTYLSKSLKGISLLNSKSCTMDVDVDFDGANVRATYAAKASEKQVSGTVGVPYLGDVDFIAGIDSKEVKAQIPMLGNDVYVYNYTEEKDGYLTDQLDKRDIESIDALCKMIYSNKDMKKQSEKLSDIFMDEYKELKFKSVAKESFEINGKQRKCKGYQTTLTEDMNQDLMDDLEDYCQETLGDTAFDELELAYYFEESREESSNIEDTDVTFYIYKNKLASIRMENSDTDMELIFHGGDTRMQNMEFLMDGDTIFEVTGETNGKVEESEFYYMGDRVATFEYDYGQGEYDLNIMNAVRLDGKLQNDRDGFCFTFDGDDVSVDLKIRKGADLEEFDGDEIDIGNASESELRSIFENLSDNYY